MSSQAALGNSAQGTFSMLPAEITRMIASMERLPVRSILNLCETSKQLQNIVCKNKAFWINLAKDRLSSAPYITRRVTKLGIKGIQQELALADIDLDDSNDKEKPYAERVDRKLAELVTRSYDRALFDYLRIQDYPFTNEETYLYPIRVAAQRHPSVFEQFLNRFPLDDRQINSLFLLVANGQMHSIIKLMLNKPQVTKDVIEDAIFDAIVNSGHVPLIELLLTSPKIDADSIEYILRRALPFAMIRPEVREPLAKLLEDPRAEPGVLNKVINELQ